MTWSRSASRRSPRRPTLVGRYGELRIGLADASVAVIAAAAKTTRLLTLDERHFRPMRPLWGEAFTLLPADQA